METISFARGAPAPELLPLEELADCAAAAVARDGRTILSYGSGAGYAPLRELIGEWFGVHPGRVVVTNGSLDGLGLLARRLASHENVLVEEPAYDRAYKALLAAGARLQTAVVDDDGLDAGDVEVVLSTQAKLAFLYTIPTFQNPTGTELSLERRERLVRYLRKRGFMIVEDDPYSLVRFEGEPLPALFDLSGKQTIYMSSFSKTIAPGLRVGWMIVPEPLAGDLTAAATGDYITPVQLGQAVAHEFISRGSFTGNLERARAGLRERRDAMLHALDRHFAGARWTRPRGGYFVWLELPEGVDARAVLARAEGVAAVAGEEFGGARNSMRLAFSFAAPDEIAEGVRRLAAAA